MKTLSPCIKINLTDKLDLKHKNSLEMVLEKDLEQSESFSYKFNEQS